jgi:aminoglycoside/choline kinase family phosphotransferase
MLPRAVINQTLQRFPDYAADDFEVRPLEKGGSERRFYRIQAGPGHSMIVVKYSSQKEENRHYVTLAQFLAEAGVSVPKIYFHDADEGLIWMQDLGEDDLWAWRNAPWEERRPLYESALREACKMHTAATRRRETTRLPLEREFSDQLYLWEQGYFFENCLRAHFGLPEQDVRRYAALPVFHNIAHHLSSLPRVLVHRDFQSQNILIREGAAWLIDFQGMRPGLPQYDVASLLFDPYVTLAAAERAALLEFYKNAARRDGMEILPDFDETYHRCALQRLMQALGAYGFLGLQKGRADFLAHIPAARSSLREVAARIDGLDEFVTLLDTLP